MKSTHGNEVIAGRIRKYLAKSTGDTVVEEVRLGLRYVGVRLENGGAGVAFNFFDENLSGCAIFPGRRPLAGRKVQEFLPYLHSRNMTETGVGLAVANASANYRDSYPDMFTGDVLDAVDLYPDDRVAMVGYFGPLVDTLRERVGELIIFEERQKNFIPPESGDETKRGSRIELLEAEREYLSQCSVALITSTSIINHTIDAILDACTNCREVVLIGASTPIIPVVFRETPVTCLSGIIIDDAEAIMHVISEGGGMRLFRNHIEKVNMKMRSEKSRPVFREGVHT